MQDKAYEDLGKTVCVLFGRRITVLGKFKSKFCAGGKEVEDMVYVSQEESEYLLISEGTRVGKVKKKTPKNLGFLGWVFCFFSR